MPRKTNRRHRKGGDGFAGKTSAEADKIASELSKKKTKEELERLSDAVQKGDATKTYESVGTGTRVPKPIPAPQLYATERARSESDVSAASKSSKGGKKTRRHHKKRRMHRR